MEPQELLDAVATARKSGYSDAEIAKYLKEQGAPDEIVAHLLQPQAAPNMTGYVKQADGSLEKAPEQHPGMLASAGAGLVQGGTLGFGDEMGLQDPAVLAAAKHDHPIVTGISQIVGSMPWLAVPGAAASPVMTGAAMGAAQGAGEAQGGLEDRAKGAAVGGAIGTGFGAAAKAAPAVVEALAPFVPGSVKRSIVRAAGRILPESDPAEAMARMGDLAPGSETMAAVDAGYAQLAGVAARSEEGGRKAIEALAGKQQAIVRGRQALGDLYNAVDKEQIPMTPQIRSILTKAGRMTQATDETIDVGTLRNLRDSYKTRAFDPISGKQTSRAMRDAAAANDEITSILAEHAPKVGTIDADYAFLSERLRHIGEGIQAVRDAASGMARQQAAGAALGSPRGSLSMGPSGFWGRMSESLTGNPEAQGQAVAQAMGSGAVPAPQGQTAADFLRANGAALPWAASNPLAQFIMNQRPAPAQQ